MKSLLAAFAFAALLCAAAAPAAATVPPPLPAAAQTFRSGSLRVGVYGTAGKPALVFIPGLTCGPWEWSREISRFARQYRIYALTLPGFDGNPPMAGPLFDTVATDVWTLLQTHHIDRPVLIGHSLGGTLGLMLASQHSDRLRGVIAVDGLPIYPGVERYTPAQRAQAGERMGAMLAAIQTPSQFEASEKSFALPYMITSPADVASVAPLTARSDPKAAGAWTAADLALDLRPQLHAITAPVLEIAPFDAKIDGATLPAAGAKRAYYASLLKNDPTATVTVISPSRHFIMYDQPEQLDGAIAAFLSRVGG